MTEPHFSFSAASQCRVSLTNLYCLIVVSIYTWHEKSTIYLLIVSSYAKTLRGTGLNLSHDLLRRTRFHLLTGYCHIASCLCRVCTHLHAFQPLESPVRELPPLPAKICWPVQPKLERESYSCPFIGLGTWRWRDGWAASHHLNFSSSLDPVRRMSWQITELSNHLLKNVWFCVFAPIICSWVMTNISGRPPRSFGV